LPRRMTLLLIGLVLHGLPDMHAVVEPAFNHPDHVLAGDQPGDAAREERCEQEFNRRGVPGVARKDKPCLLPPFWHLELAMKEEADDRPDRR
jgi:hypothetical protein